ncbi:response regulator [Arthrobacter sp. MMS24-S77]
MDIIDNHAIVRECLGIWLKSKSDSIEVAGSYASWAEVLSNLSDLSDVVLMDVLLGDNLPLSVKIKMISSAGSQVVVFSGITDSSVIRQSHNAGALGFISKSAGTDVMSAAIKSAAQGIPYFPDAAAAILAPGRSPVRLTSREHEVVSLYLGSSGPTAAEVATALNRSPETVRKQLASVRRKFRSRYGGLTRIALREHLLAEGWLIEEQRPQ